MVAVSPTRVTPQLYRWVCQGTRTQPNGATYPCRTVLMELDPTPGTFVRIKCPRCGTWATWTTPDTLHNAPVSEMAGSPRADTTKED